MSYQVEEFEVPITWTENYTKGWVEKSGDTYIAKINGTDPKAHWSGYSVYAKVNLRTFAESRIRNLQSIAKIYVSELRIDGHWWASNFYGTAWNWISYKGVSEKRMTIKGDEGWKENKMKINEEISVDNPYVTLVHEAGGDAVLPFGYAEVGTEADVYVLPAWNERKEEQRKLPAFNMRVFYYFGIKAKVKISQNGKAEFIPFGVETKPKIEEMIVKNGVRVVIIDSFSQIFKEPFPGNQSLGARARAEDMLYALIKETGLKHPNVFFFLNHHLSINPNRGTLDLTGGASVIQNSKLTIALIKRGGALRNFVEVQTYRHARKEVWEHAGWLRIDPEMGFVTSSQKEIEQVLTEVRKK